MYFKYMFKNIFSFFSENLMIFLLLIVSTIVSSVVIFFSYGIYQNYNLVLTYNETDPGNNAISIYFNGVDGEYVTKDDVLNCIYEIGNISAELKENVVLYTLEGELDGGYGTQLKFSYENGEIKYPETFIYNMYEEEFLIEGRFWTEYEDSNASRVLLISEMDENSVGDELTIDGYTYEIIGRQFWSNGFLMPVLSVPYMEAEYMNILLDSSVSTGTFNKIKSIFCNELGDKVIFDEIETIDKDTYYTYKTVMLVAIFIALVAASNFMILYRYIISTRKRTTAIYKILGLTSSDLNLINLGECLLLIIPFFIVGMLIYKKLILPGLINYFAYIYDAYTPLIYVCLFGIFIIVSIVVIGIMLFSANRKGILTLMKDRG